MSWYAWLSLLQGGFRPSYQPHVLPLAPHAAAERVPLSISPAKSAITAPFGPRLGNEIGRSTIDSTTAAFIVAIRGHHHNRHAGKLLLDLREQFQAVHSRH